MSAEKKQRKILPVWLYIVIYTAVIAVCVTLDQLTKRWIFDLTHTLPLSSSDGDNWWTASGDRTVNVLGTWLQFSWTTNDGATGGLFSGLSWSNWLFFVMTVVGVPVFAWLLWRSRTRSVWGQIAYSFVIGGTLGNAADRLFLAQRGFFTGEVRDFVRVENFFGIFNTADSFLVVGVIMALLAIIFFDPDSLLKSILNERKAKSLPASVADGDQTQNERTEVNGSTLLQQDTAQHESGGAAQPQATPDVSNPADEPDLEHTDENR